MTAISVSDITSSTTSTIGTGSFDILMESVNNQILKQWEQGRLSGADYAAVYLGALQAVLEQSVKFALSKESAGLQADEIAASTVRNDADSSAKIALTEEQKAEVIEATGRSNAETVASIALMDAKRATENTNTIDATAGAAKDKSDLMTAQALGFSNNTKQSLLKSMLDGYATNLAVAGVADVPESTRDSAIDQLSQNILDSLTTTNTPVRVQIQSVAEVADVDTGA
jgi:hypothetical protein